jgi:hypothetical protein
MKFNRHEETIKMPRLVMAALLLAASVLPAHAAGTYEATVGARLIDLDFRGSRGQVQEYDGKLYRGAHGDVSVSNQGSEGLFDFSMKDIGSTEEEAALSVDHKSGFRLNGKFQNMHHRLNYIRVGEIHGGVWIPKLDIQLLRVTENQELVIRRTESELNFGFVSPENAARFLVARIWNVEKSGVMSWSLTGTPNILRTAVAVDNTKRDISLGLGTNIKEDGAMSLDLIRSEFIDAAEKIASPVDGAVAGSSDNGGVLKRQNGRQNMNAAEIKFRHDVSKNLAVTGAFTGRQRENMYTQYKFNAVVGALNAAYRASNKLSLVAKLYLRAYEVDENRGYFPASERAATAARYLNVTWDQTNKMATRAEFTANYRPVEKVNVKAAYKLEVNLRKYPGKQIYSASRWFSDGYFVNEDWNNETARYEARHTFTVGTKVDLPLDAEIEGQYKKMVSNRGAFVNSPTLSDEASGSLNLPLPLHLDMTLEGGYLKEKNNVARFINYSQTRNTYRAGLDWTGSNRAFFGADVSYESIRNFQELFFGSGDASEFTTAGTAFHESVMTKHVNKTVGVHGKVICPKGFVVMGNGSYTDSTVSTPMHYRYQVAQTPGAQIVNDFTPSNVNIARGSVSVEYTPEKLKSLTARAGYSISDWVDRFDSLNSGRASVAQVGAAYKF